MPPPLLWLSLGLVLLASATTLIYFQVGGCTGVSPGWFKACADTMSGIKSPLALLVLFGAQQVMSVDVSWHAPNATKINNLDKVLSSDGVYGFIFDSSQTPDKEYGKYNWCNMPHVRPKEYPKAPKGYKLQYVEIVCNSMREIHANRRSYCTATNLFTRYIDTTNVHLMSPTHFHRKRILGTVMMKASFTTVNQSMAERVPNPTGRATRTRLTRSSLQGLKDHASFPRSQKKVWMTRGSTAVISMQFTINSCISSRLGWTTTKFRSG